MFFAGKNCSLKRTAFWAALFEAVRQWKAGFLWSGYSYCVGGAFCTSGTGRGVRWMVTGVPTLVCL